MLTIASTIHAIRDGRSRPTHCDRQHQRLQGGAGIRLYLCSDARAFTRIGGPACGEIQGSSCRPMASATALRCAQTREEARLPCYTRNQGSGTTAADGPAVDDAEVPENGEKHVAGERQADTCLRARAGSALTATAWLPLSAGSSARRCRRRRNRDCSAPASPAFRGPRVSRSALAATCVPAKDGLDQVSCDGRR
jgi:hypothetical protein